MHSKSEIFPETCTCKKIPQEIKDILTEFIGPFDDALISITKHLNARIHFWLPSISLKMLIN